MSKNNPANRRKGAQGKSYDGKKVKPVLYIGSRIGHGKYMAVQYEDGNMAYDKNKKPIMWDAI